MTVSPTATVADPQPPTAPAVVADSQLGQPALSRRPPQLTALVDFGPGAPLLQRLVLNVRHPARGPGRKYGTPVSGWQQQLVSQIGVPDHAANARNRAAQHAAIGDGA